MIEVAAGIIRRDGHILIARRPADSHLGGLWEFPGGTREPGETLEECLVREIREELDFTVRVERHALAVTQSYPDRDVHLHFFECVPVAGSPAALGCQEFRWVAPPELDGYEFPPADRTMLERLKGAGPA
jgi:8-oxo-dGTP diphosphatase